MTGHRCLIIKTGDGTPLVVTLNAIVAHRLISEFVGGTGAFADKDNVIGELDVAAPWAVKVSEVRSIQEFDQGMLQQQVQPQPPQAPLYGRGYPGASGVN